MPLNEDDLLWLAIMRRELRLMASVVHIVAVLYVLVGTVCLIANWWNAFSAGWYCASLWVLCTLHTFGKAWRSPLDIFLARVLAHSVLAATMGYLAVSEAGTMPVALRVSWGLSSLLALISLRQLWASQAEVFRPEGNSPLVSYRAPGFWLTAFTVLWLVAFAWTLLSPLLLIFSPPIRTQVLVPGLIILAANIDGLYMASGLFNGARIALTSLLLGLFYVLCGSYIIHFTFAALQERQDVLSRLFLLWVVCSTGLAIVPRRIRARSLGTPLTRAQEPSLWDVVDEMAAAVSIAPPREVVLVWEANAYAAGIGRSRVLVIGLPLLVFLTKSEFRAVIAHEFGHYASRDSSWAVRMYHCRNALENVVSRFRAIAQATPCLLKPQIRLMSAPFRGYAWVFRKTIRSIVYDQEYSADRTSATIVGPTALRGALKKVGELSGKLQEFWDGQVLPQLSRGYLPSLSSDWAKFLEQRELATEGTVALVATNRSGENDDLHPTIESRLRRIENAPEPFDVDTDEPLAISLLTHVEEHERELAEHMGFRGVDRPSVASRARA